MLVAGQQPLTARESCSACVRLYLTSRKLSANITLLWLRPMLCPMFQGAQSDSSLPAPRQLPQTLTGSHNIVNNNSTSSSSSSQLLVVENSSNVSPELLLMHSETAAAAAAAVASPGNVPAGLPPPAAAAAASHAHLSRSLPRKRPRQQQTKATENQCANCKAVTSSYWRRDPLDSSRTLCNACGLFKAKHGTERPRMLWISQSSRNERRLIRSMEHSADSAMQALQAYVSRCDWLRKMIWSRLLLELIDAVTWLNSARGTRLWLGCVLYTLERVLETSPDPVIGIPQSCYGAHR